MEKECFEDNEVAQILNDNFISIKVDREERPDIDSIYMSVCQAINGNGGWPLTIIMTPEKQPFFAGTYLPKKAKYGQPGLIDLLTKIDFMWKTNKKDIVLASSDIVNRLKTQSDKEEGELSSAIIENTYSFFKGNFDTRFGGFGSSPKFPSPHNMSFLLMYYKSKGDKNALEMVKRTLDSMYKGGIFDHIGGGFSRYSVDKKWLVPHFEKMLYDNALLAIVYLQFYQETGENRYKEVVEKIFTYILRDMASTEGGFYSAEDADSEGEEGKFYLWSTEEIREALQEEEAKLFCKYYDISLKGNFEGKNIPNLIGIDLTELEDPQLANKLEEIKQKLFKFREKRIHPHKDDKILTSWNGLMIAALAIGARELGENKYLEAAKKAVEFIFEKLQNDEGRLLARYRDGDSAFLGYIDDYAFFIWALIEMYETTFNPFYLEKALILNTDMLNLFWDEEKKGLFIYGKDSEQLILKNKEIYDGAIPSGNSIAAMNMLRLSRITENLELENKANEIFSCFGGTVKEAPYTYASFMSAYLYSEIAGKFIVISGTKDRVDTQEMLKVASKGYQPFTIMVFNDGSEEVNAIIPSLKNKVMLEGNVTAYVCENGTCSEPTTFPIKI